MLGRSSRGAALSGRSCRLVAKAATVDLEVNAPTKVIPESRDQFYRRSEEGEDPQEKTAWILRPTPPGYRTSGGVGWLASARFS
jgi:hypothetical protein